MKTLGSAAALVLIGLSLLVGNAGAQTETNLYSFGGSPNDGANPHAGLVQGSDGNFYGTTESGGAGTNCYGGCGTVFRISPGGSYTGLYSFVGYPSDGANPKAGLMQGSDGNFYGTTYQGGTNGCNCGTVFRISPSGSYTNLHSFVGSPTDGGYPYAGLIQSSDGNFYGTTYGGGTSNAGTAFRITSGGSEAILYSFGGYPDDGIGPIGGLVQGSDGNFYGTTYRGGAATNVISTGVGIVFRISPSGNETNLYSFMGYPNNDGALPECSLVQGGDGSFYGTTESYEQPGGTVFRIGPSGSYSNLYSFGSFVGIYAGLVLGSDGNFYGATTYGQGNGQGGGNGTVFQIRPSGSFSNLYSFGGGFDGGFPNGLVQGSEGNFYGMTQGGGTSTNCGDGCGTVFKLTVPLNPPANQISAILPVGNDMALSVPSVAGETYQLQFSSSLTPTNWVNVSGGSVTNSIGALMTLTNLGGALLPQGFYRFDITP